MIDPQTLTVEKDHILFLSNDKNSDLYIIKKGKVMVFVQKGSQIIPVAYLGAGEYIGELSFFDNKSRSASIICLEETTFVKILSTEMNALFPAWLKIIALQLTRKIRENDELIRTKGIRKKNVETIKQLTVEEQTHWFKLVDLHKTKLIPPKET